MKHSILISVVLLLNLIITSSKASALTYDEAVKLWEESRFDAEFGEYMGEFAQYNNYHKLDTRNGCFELGEGPTEIFFEITNDGASNHYRISRAIHKEQSDRLSCFKESYLGVPVKQPPFMPFVFKMEFN